MTTLRSLEHVVSVYISDFIIMNVILGPLNLLLMSLLILNNWFIGQSCFPQRWHFEDKYVHGREKRALWFL